MTTEKIDAVPSVRVKPLSDDQIMEIIKAVTPWKVEPKLYDLLTREKSAPLIPQATYDVPSYRATALVRAIEARVYAQVLAASPPPPSGALDEIAAERRRQIEAEGWTPKHDDKYHRQGQLALAAACYAVGSQIKGKSDIIETATVKAARWCYWPWADEWWKPTSRRRDLIKAGALIVAEIERLDRQEPNPMTTTEKIDAVWRYSINYGPDGQEDWANLITPEGELVANIRIHHARRIVAALTASPPPPSGALPDAEPVAFTTGHCPERKKPGGCQLHNLHCGYPNCDRRPGAAPVVDDAAVERAARAMAGILFEDELEGDAESEWMRLAHVARAALAAGLKGAQPMTTEGIDPMGLEAPAFEFEFKGRHYRSSPPEPRPAGAMWPRLRSIESIPRPTFGASP